MPACAAISLAIYAAGGVVVGQLIEGEPGIGKTNQWSAAMERAGELSLPRSLSDVSLARIYRKLGIKSRAELGRHFGRPHEAQP